MGEAPQKEFDDRKRLADIQAVNWFLDLIHARGKDKFKQAAEATEALEGMGIRVRFGRSPRGRRERN